MKRLISESGIFLVNECGVAESFEAAADNPFRDEITERDDNYSVRTYRTIRTFVVPEGIRGFASEFMRGVRVEERFVLPGGVLSVGNFSFESGVGQHSVFADCILPEVRIPPGVRMIGNYAFGCSHIESLTLPADLRSPYGRQFKDSYIGRLLLPAEWKGRVRLEDGGLHSGLPSEYEYLRWPSTKIGCLSFFE